MEENEKKEPEVIEEGPVNETKSATSSAVVDFIKAKKKIIAIVIVAIIAVIVIFNMISVSPKDAVQGFVKQLNSGHTKKAFDYIDWAGFVTLSELDEDDYEDFWEKYKDIKDTDEYEEYMDSMEEYMDEDFYEDMDEEIKDSDASIKIKKITKVKKVAKNLYSVKAKIQTKDEDGEINSEIMEFYVMKKGMKSYIVSMPGSLY